MKILDKLIGLLKKRNSKTVPLLIIKKDSSDDNVKEYNSIEAAITDLEKNPNVNADLIKRLKSSFINLKNNNPIRIKNGEIIK